MDGQATQNSAMKAAGPQSLANNEANYSKSDQIIMGSRDKSWEDCTVEEKLERLRVHVKGVEREVARVSSDIETLFAHSHEENGKIIFVLSKEERHRLRNNGLGAGLASIQGPNFF